MQKTVRVILSIWLMGAAAHGSICIVQSTNHGGGLFSYTFQRGDEPYVWGLGPNFGVIELQSQGVTEVQAPAGWNYSVSPSGRVTFSVTNGFEFLDAPVVFTVRSCLTESAIYRPDAPLGPESPIGYIASVVFTLPEHTQTTYGGVQFFEFVGPALPSLSIERRIPDVILRWSAEAQGLQLEAIDELGGSAAWSSVTNIPTVVNSMFEVRLPATDPARFFRLVGPCSR